MQFFPCTGSKQAIPSGWDGYILPARIANQNTGFASYGPRRLPAIWRENKLCKNTQNLLLQWNSPSLGCCILTTSTWSQFLLKFFIFSNDCSCTIRKLKHHNWWKKKSWLVSKIIKASTLSIALFILLGINNLKCQ